MHNTKYATILSCACPAYNQSSVAFEDLDVWAQGTYSGDEYWCPAWSLVSLVSEPKQAASASFLLPGIQLLKQIPETN